MRTGILVFVLAWLLIPRAFAFRITIDPGHGGIDTGAVHGSLKESDLVLKVALKLRDLLATEPGVNVFMTRSRDQAISLPDRVRKASALGADLFVSLHANAAPDGRARGLELFFQNSLPPDEDVLYLANLENQSTNLDDPSIAEVSRKGDVAAIVADLHRQSRILSSLHLSQALADSLQSGADKRRVAIKQAPLFVVSKTTMPSVLVELGFLTHRGEARKLASEDYQDDLADRLKEAILRYKRGIKTPSRMN